MFIRFSFECLAMHYNFAIYMYACTYAGLFIKVWYLRFFILVDKEIHQLSCQCNHSFKNDRFFHGCLFFISLFVFCFGTFGTIGTFDYIEKKYVHPFERTYM